MYVQRRKDKRFRIMSLADVCGLTAAGIADRAVVVDISTGGLAFVSTSVFFPGDIVSLNLLREKLNVDGVINRVDQEEEHYIYGVEFKDISLADKKKISGMISVIYEKIVKARLGSGKRKKKN